MLTHIREIIADIVFPEGREERRSLERYANEDPLTGLANRRAFDLAIGTAEADPNVAVVIFDLNNFGRVNKLESHAVGDALLKHTARLLGEHGSGRAFRYGGDEFVALVPQRCAGHYIYQIEGDFDVMVLKDGTEVSISGSLGNTLAEAEINLQKFKTARKRRTT